MKTKIIITIITLLTTYTTYGNDIRLCIIVADEMGHNDTLNYGFVGGATKCLDSWLGEIELPSSTGYPEFISKFITSARNSNECLGNGIKSDFHSAYEYLYDDTFKIIFHPDLMPIHVYWDPNLLKLNNLSGELLIDGNRINMLEVSEATVSENYLAVLYVKPIYIFCPQSPAVYVLSEEYAMPTSILMKARISYSANPTSAYFEYGKTSSYGLTTPLRALSSFNFWQPVSGLEPSTSYHYRCVVYDYGDSDKSNDRVFRTADITGIGTKTILPEKTFLSPNYPNPFNPSTTIEYQIANTGFVTLNVYNILGKKVSSLVNEIKSPGTYTVHWDAAGLPGGVYYYRIRTKDFNQTHSMVITK